MLVVVAKQVQQAVHDQMRPVDMCGLALLQRLTFHERCTDDKIAKQVSRGKTWGWLKGKREYVRGSVPMAVASVQLSGLLLTH